MTILNLPKRTPTNVMLTQILNTGGLLNQFIDLVGTSNPLNRLISLPVNLSVIRFNTNAALAFLISIHFAFAILQLLFRQSVLCVIILQC